MPLTVHCSCNTMQCMKNDDQITLRVARDVAAALEQRARERRVPKSQLVREALEAYLAGPPREDAAETWSRVAPLVGSVALDPGSAERDALARRLRAHNWRS